MQQSLKITALIALLMLGACSSDINDDMPIEKEPKAVFLYSFIENEASTRGTPITSVNGLQNLIIYADDTGNGTENEWSSTYTTAVPNFFNGQELTNTGYNTGTTSWSYSPTMYWPADTTSNVTFFAYGPIEDSNGLTVGSTTGGLTIEYEAPTDCLNQPDFVMCKPAIDQDGQNGSTVPLSMQHMLSCVSFSAIGTFNTIRTISLSNISVGGTVSYSLAEDSLIWTLDDPVSQDYYGIINSATLYAVSTVLTPSDGYLMLPPQALGSDATITVTMDNDSTQTFNLSGLSLKAGQRVTFQVNVGTALDDISIQNIQSSFVGAYWRYNETGERIIRMNNTGSWSAAVIATEGDWDASDIYIDGLPSTYPDSIGIAITSPILQMDSNAGMLNGTGNISFRVGLKEGTTLASASTAPRYAVILIKYDDASKNHLLFLRQGEAPAVIAGTGLFSPYNLSSNIASTSSTTYELTDYPSLGGGYQQWSTDGVIYPSSVSDDDKPSTSINTTALANACPSGLRPPTYDALNSLNSGASIMGGLYADGYCDRLGFSLIDNSSGIYYITAENNTVFMGTLYYNTTSLASLFMPFAGEMTGSNFTYSNGGLYGWYWASDESTTADLPYVLEVVCNNQEASSNKSYAEMSTLSPELGLSIRPVATD